MSIGFASAQEPQPLVERQRLGVDLQNAQAHRRATVMRLLHDEQHAPAADTLALMLWQEEQLIDSNAVRLLDNRYDPDVGTSHTSAGNSNPTTGSQWCRRW